MIESRVSMVGIRALHLLHGCYNREYLIDSLDTAKPYGSPGPKVQPCRVSTF